MVEQQNENEQVAWNLSQSILTQIGYLIQSSSSHFRNGETQTAFLDVEEIRTLIHPDLKKEDKEELDKLSEKIIRLYGVYLKYYRKVNEPSEDMALSDEDEEKKYIFLMKKAKFLHYKAVQKYRRLIQDLLAKYGYGVARKEDSSRMF